MRPACFAHPAFPDHALLDSGDARKLERYGAVVLARPDPQALWRPRLARDDWDRADLCFVRESDRGGRWEPGPRAAPARGAGAREEWSLRSGRATLLVRPTPFKHLGLFPEQAANWAWIAGLHAANWRGAERPPRLLNLFGYTGAASVLAALDGWSVTHVDASKTSIAWALANARASGLGADALRVVLDDALAFARREQRRGERYEAVLLDPPHHGRGPRGETWRFEEGAAELVEVSAALLAERAGLVLTSYAIGTSPLAFANLLEGLGPGEVEAAELALPEEPRPGLPARLLPCGFCGRFSRGLRPPQAASG